jgi:hypothetical protein
MQGHLGRSQKRAQRACGQGPVLKRISGMRHRAPDRAHEVLTACGGVCELASGCLGPIAQVRPYGARAGPPGAGLSAVITFWPSPVAVSRVGTSPGRLPVSRERPCLCTGLIARRSSGAGTAVLEFLWEGLIR